MQAAIRFLVIVPSAVAFSNLRIRQELDTWKKPLRRMHASGTFRGLPTPTKNSGESPNMGTVAMASTKWRVATPEVSERKTPHNPIKLKNEGFHQFRAGYGRLWKRPSKDGDEDGVSVSRTPDLVTALADRL